ncbi:MAG: ABC transporter permease [Opitutaceae bacterium]|nr:ABC transporter permease [Opitutaceae bacterium]
MNGRLLRWLLPMAGGTALVGLWYALRHAFGIPAWLLPVPHEILEALGRERALIGAAAWQTTQSALLGFLSAAAGGLVCAILLASSRPVRLALYPYLLILQMTPVIVLAPFIVLWAGRGMGSIVIVTFIVSFFPVVVNTTHGMVSTDRGLVELFDVCNAGPLQRIFLLHLPFATPYYFAGLRIAATLAPIGAIFAEYVTGSIAGGTGGLGFLASVFNQRQMRAELLAVALTSCVLGFVFLAVIATVNRLLLRRWHASATPADA